MTKFFLNTVKREGTPYSIAMGVALGLFIGFFIPMGGQIAIVLPLAFLFKANKILSCIFTLPTNPYTVPFIYPVQCWFGSIVMGDPMDYERLKTIFGGLLKDPSWGALIDLGQEIVVPFFVAGGIFAVVSAVPGYFIAYRAVVKYRDMKARKISSRQEMLQTRKTLSQVNMKNE